MKKLSAICFLISVLAHLGLAQNRASQVEILLKQGEVYLEDYEFEKALAVCEEVLKKNQSAKRQSPAKLASVYYLEGRIYEKGLYLDKAIASYTTALKFDSKNPDIYQSRAGIYKYIGETAKAEADFEKVENLIKTVESSTQIQAVSTIGIVVGNVNAASIEYTEEFQTIGFKEISGYSEAVKIKDTDKDGKISQEEFRQAHISHLLKLNKLVRFNSESDLALWKRGDFYLQLNELSNQIFWVSTDIDFTNAFEINPRFEYLVNRGVVRAKRDNKTNYEFAVKFFSDAIQINNNCVEAFYNRGLSYLKLSENEMAVADFTEVIKLDAKFALAYKSRAKVFRAVGKIAEADADEAMLKRLGGK